MRNVFMPLSASNSSAYSENQQSSAKPNSLNVVQFSGREDQEKVGESNDRFAVLDEKNQQPTHRSCQQLLPAVEPLQRQLWGRYGEESDSPVGSNQTVDDGDCGLDMLPQDPALILPDQVDFYAQIKVRPAKALKYVLNINRVHHCIHISDKIILYRLK